MKKLHEKLAGLHALSAKTEASERNILAGAEQRLAAVQKKLDAMDEQSIVADEGKGRAYLQLVHERGTLNQVIAKARQLLQS